MTVDCLFRSTSACYCRPDYLKYDVLSDSIGRSALPDKYTHERIRQTRFTEAKEWTYTRVFQFELILNKKMSENHLHND